MKLYVVRLKWNKVVQILQEQHSCRTLFTSLGFNDLMEWFDRGKSTGKNCFEWV